MHCASNGLADQGGSVLCIFGLAGSGYGIFGVFDTLEAYMHWRGTFGTFGSFGLLLSFSCQSG